MYREDRAAARKAAVDGLARELESGINGEATARRVHAYSAALQALAIDEIVTIAETEQAKDRQKRPDAP